VLLLLTYWLPDNQVPEGGSAKILTPSEPASVETQTVRATPGPPSCLSDLSIRPKSGAELGGRHRGGLGKLRVENGTGSDAVAVFVDVSTDVARRAIFIRAGESGSITSVPIGNYRLRFQLGSDWLSERRFCQVSGTSEFDETFDFQEIKSDRGTNYSTYEVTLHAVLLGTAKTHQVSNSVFELPDP